MSATARNSNARQALIWIFTCCAATAAGAFLGILASVWYDMELGEPYVSGAGVAGLWSGAISGLIAAVCWCLRVFARYDRCPHTFCTRYGAIVGVAVGVFSGISVHVTLMIVTGSAGLYGILLGIAFGLAAGAALGSFCASMFRVPSAVENQE